MIRCRGWWLQADENLLYDTVVITENCVYFTHNFSECSKKDHIDNILFMYKPYICSIYGRYYFYMDNMHPLLLGK